ncbi:unnamed protein product [Haemonchus placei]|uniref:Uncharacterized protein n=1 Tax=Haemonchus placei TaxID=6290 RepID=A0A3P7V4C9_HAEPC|nr:unnamed protein product [Haemonchus placei]
MLIDNIASTIVVCLFCQSSKPVVHKLVSWTDLEGRCQTYFTIIIFCKIQVEMKSLLEA